MAFGAGLVKFARQFALVGPHNMLAAESLLQGRKDFKKVRLCLRQRIPGQVGIDDFFYT